MIVKLTKELKDCKIGLLGFRQDILKPVLDELNINYVSIDDMNTIDDTYDFVFMTGVYKLIPINILNAPTYGIFGFHETPLPEGRGHAPINWTIENNRPNITISLFKAGSGVDDGLIVYQHNVPIYRDDDRSILEFKRQYGVTECFRVFIFELLEGVIILREQSGLPSYSKKRKATNSELDVNKTLIELWDHLRLCHNDYYPAFFMLNENTKVILKYTIDRS